MGFFKIAAFIAVPITGLTYAAFSLGKQLPKASRLFGNYIGLSYVYFKCMLKVLKPQQKMPYQMIQIARKASQQSQALRRELRNTIKRAKQDLNKKHQQTLAKFQQKINMNQSIENQKIQIVDKQSKDNLEGSQALKQIFELRQQIKSTKKLKNESKKFFEQI